MGEEQEEESRMNYLQTQGKWMPACGGMTTLLIAVLLTACATDVTTYHNACLQEFHAFTEQVACVKRDVAADPSLKNDTLVQEYVLAGEVLAKQVQAGKLSEDQARLQFVHRLNDIDQRRADLLAQQARAYHAEDWDRPHFANCRHVGNSVQCTSY
jgi:hypothetical protein